MPPFPDIALFLLVPRAPWSPSFFGWAFQLAVLPSIVAGVAVWCVLGTHPWWQRVIAGCGGWLILVTWDDQTLLFSVQFCVVALILTVPRSLGYVLDQRSPGEDLIHDPPVQFTLRHLCLWMVLAAVAFAAAGRLAWLQRDSSAMFQWVMGAACATSVVPLSLLWPAFSPWNRHRWTLATIPIVALTLILAAVIVQRSRGWDDAWTMAGVIGLQTVLVNSAYLVARTHGVRWTRVTA